MFVLFTARSPIYPYPYSPGAAVTSIERPLMNSSNLPFAQPSNAMMNTMTMQQLPPIPQPQPQQQQQLSAFPTNLNLNQETALAHVCYHTDAFRSYFKVRASKKNLLEHKKNQRLKMNQRNNSMSMFHIYLLTKIESF